VEGPHGYAADDPDSAHARGHAPARGV
jgi:hypothetical protein